MARGTIYNNVDAPERLFEEIAARLTDEMHERIAVTAKGPRDPALSLANGLRLFVRQAHEQPHWGKFILRFGLSMEPCAGCGRANLQSIWSTVSRAASTVSAAWILAIIAGAGLSAMFMVLEGHTTWRDAGSDAAKLVLRALGVDPDEAHRIAQD